MSNPNPHDNLDELQREIHEMRLMDAQDQLAEMETDE